MCFLIYTVPFDPQVNPVMHSWNSSPHLTQEEKEHKVAQLIRGREFANLGHLLLDQCSFICTMEGFKVFPSRMIMFPSLEKQGRGKIGIISNYLSHHLVPLGFLSSVLRDSFFFLSIWCSLVFILVICPPAVLVVLCLCLGPEGVRTERKIILTFAF